ncbi:putative phytanoyl- dioxygenase family protein [Diplodia seriata]|uniref:Putative phytanoyl-dioxygenase family protein n=1 Tax=Diplodia seriata TaxID=420778 RepID=A0A0G2DT91_9PEZI|nr:putative phytanoyl- dioxygenase family protein [Diplodia seriata]
MQPPAPSIRRIPYSAPRADFIAALETDGCVVVQNFTDLHTLAQAKREVQPYLDAEDKGTKLGGESAAITRPLVKLCQQPIKHWKEGPKPAPA